MESESLLNMLLATIEKRSSDIEIELKEFAAAEFSSMIMVSVIVSLS
jgi:hypothetical protein